MKRVVFHADDFGICEPATDGILKAFSGLITSASIMAPCDGFEHAINRYLAYPGDLDVGLHSTLTTGGISKPYGPVDPDVPSLTDEFGFFFSTAGEMTSKATKSDIARELKAQLCLCISKGIEITHIDSHMFIANDQNVSDSIMELAWDLRLPFVGGKFRNKQSRKKMQEMGFPLFNSISVTKNMQQLKQHLLSLEQGLHYVILHPALRSPDLKRYLPDTWERREDDYEICTNGTLNKLTMDLNIKPIGMRELMNDLRNSCKWV